MDLTGQKIFHDLGITAHVFAPDDPERMGEIREICREVQKEIGSGFLKVV